MSSSPNSTCEEVGETVQPITSTSEVSRGGTLVRMRSFFFERACIVSRLGIKKVSRMQHGNMKSTQDKSYRISKGSVESGAIFDSEERYRYLLWRQWASDMPSGEEPCSTHKATVLFIMLNPSTADDKRNDPTIARCAQLSKLWGFERAEIVNLFAYKATQPQTLRRASDPVGPDNDRFILEAAQRADCIIAAWGNHGTLLARDEEVLRLIPERHRIWCFGKTKIGAPKHPLYLGYGVEPTRLC